MAIKDLFAALGVAALCVASFALARVTAPKAPVLPPEVKTDTLIVRDTITAYTPVFVDREVVRFDTLRVRDTVLVPLPIERRIYQDTNYRAVVSGWRPSLDEITVYPETKYVTTVETHTVKEAPKWSFGVGAGLSLGKDGAGPALVVSVQRVIASW